MESLLSTHVYLLGLIVGSCWGIFICLHLDPDEDRDLTIILICGIFWPIALSIIAIFVAIWVLAIAICMVCRIPFYPKGGKL